MREEDVGAVKSGARILDLLEYIAGHDRPVSLAQVVAELGIPKSSGLMLLRTLVSKQYVERDNLGRYQLDRIFEDVQGGWVGGRTALLRKLARPHMRQLAESVQETIVLGILTADHQVKVIERVRSPREVRYEIEVGVKYPAYCTSMGRSILGFTDQTVVDDYLRTVPRTKCTPKTVIDTGPLRDILAEVRRQGYAVNIEEHVDGASSVAAPLIDDGQVLGSLNVGCVTSNFLANREHITSHLVATAACINQELDRRHRREQTG